MLLFGVLHVWKGSILFILQLLCPQLAVQWRSLPSLRPAGYDKEKGTLTVEDEKVESNPPV